MATLTEAFCRALRTAEDRGMIEPLSDLFAADAVLTNASLHCHGSDAAQRFWKMYLDQFNHVRSTFTHVIETDGQSALAWRSEGQLKGGEPVCYRGVSLLEIADGKVQRFEAIYETAAFVRPYPAAEADVSGPAGR